jgi:uncharacterized protein YkwD
VTKLDNFFMILSNANPSANHSPIFRIYGRSLTAAILLLLTVTICRSASAQDIQNHPVARLVSGSANNPAFLRSRRVTSEESTTIVTPEAGATRAWSLGNATPIERSAFEKTNQTRVENGLAPLTWDSELCRMAREHSESMARLEYFSHKTPQGLRLKERAHESGILHFRVIAENIAYNKGYDDPGAFAVERWMISSGHRANILYVGFQASAIGSYVSADGGIYLTQVFIAR